MFGISDFSAFCLAVIVFLAIPGPGTFALLNSTGRVAFAPVPRQPSGVIAGDQVLLWLQWAESPPCWRHTPPLAFNIVQYGGAAYLGWIGLRLLITKPGAASPSRFNRGSTPNRRS